MNLRLTKLEKSWILYDIANSAFVLLVATLLPIYFDYLADKGNLSDSDYLAYWGYAGSVATVLVAIIGPICGTLADQRGFKKAAVYHKPAAWRRRLRCAGLCLGLAAVFGDLRDRPDGL